MCAPGTLLDASHTLNLILSMAGRPSYAQFRGLHMVGQVAHGGNKSVKASHSHSKMNLPSSSTAEHDCQASNQPKCLAATHNQPTVPRLLKEEGAKGEPETAGSPSLLKQGVSATLPSDSSGRPPPLSGAILNQKPTC